MFLVLQGAYCSCEFQGKAAAPGDDAASGELAPPITTPPISPSSSDNSYRLVVCVTYVSRTQSQMYTETIVMNCRTKVACKTMWKSCVEQHSFFRLPLLLLSLN